MRDSQKINAEDLPYKTLASPGQSETLVEKSRFLSHALPVCTEEEAQVFLEAARKKHYDARHICFGFRIGRGFQIIDRSNDDGEPARSAGLPIWQVIEGRELTDTLVYVIRYFGGIKLGMGGLARAYRDAARQALDDAQELEVFPEAMHTLEIPYSLHGKAEHLFEELPALRIINVAFGAEVTYSLGIRKVDYSDVTHRLAALLQVSPEELFLP